MHPYSEDRSPLHPGVPGWMKLSFARGVPEVRKTLVRHGEKKPIWLTEFGWSTCSVRNTREAWANCVDPSTQATYLQQAFRQMQSWSYVPVGVTFNLEDTSDDRGDRVDNYGLLRTDGSPKPAFAALRRAADALEKPPRAVPAKERLTLRFRRAAGRAWVAGRLPGGKKVRVKVHRFTRGGRRAVYDRTIRVRPDGRFRRGIRLAARARGRWVAVAKVRRRPRLAASAVLR